MGVFNGWFSTRWYEMLYRHRDEQDAAGLALPLIAKGKLLTGMEILDMACGRGRHASVFAREGLRVTGIDLSAESIREAATAAPSARFEVFDMRNPYANGRFDAVVCLFTSLGYTGDRTDDVQAVVAATQALKPGGLFVLDLFNGERAAQSLVPLERIKIDHVEFEVRKSREGDEIVKRIKVEHDGEVESFEERVHAWTVEEVKTLINSGGLQLEDITDSTCMVAFNRLRSDRIVAWARKSV